MLLERAFQEDIRDWIILGLSAILLVWTCAGAFFILQARKTPFNRLWASRLLLVLTGFLWPGCFVLTTHKFQQLIPPLEALGSEGSCDIFVLLVHAIFEPAFCILLVFHLQFDWNLCSRMLCLPRGHTKTGEYLEAISGVCICFFTLLLLLPSLAYHLGWNILSSSSPWHTEQQPTIGPCMVSLADLLGTSFYGLITLVMLHVYARRLDAVALNEGLRRRVTTLRISTTLSLLIQILLRYISAIYPPVTFEDYASNCIFILYFIAVVYTSMSVVWFLALRPVLYDVSLHRRLAKRKPSPPALPLSLHTAGDVAKSPSHSRHRDQRKVTDAAGGGGQRGKEAVVVGQGTKRMEGREGRESVCGEGRQGMWVEGEEGVTVLISSVMLGRHDSARHHASHSPAAKHS